MFAGFQTDVAKFFVFTLTIFMVGFCAAALGWLFSATVSVFAIANLLIALCYVFMMVSHLDTNKYQCCSEENDLLAYSLYF